MELVIRVQSHTEHEIHLLHKLSFSILPSMENNSQDSTKNIISVTSDMDGFTTLSALCREVNLNAERVKLDADESNQLGKTRLISAVNPSLFLVPKSTNTNLIEFPEFTITELVKVAHYFNSDTIHFTHYSFLESFPKDEIIKIMILLLNPFFVPNIKEFVWEIDSRYQSELLASYTHVISSIYRRTPKELSVVHAKKFKFIYDQVVGNTEVGRFVEDED